MKTLLAILTGLCAFGLPYAAAAGGIQVSPSKIELPSADGSLSAEVTVVNPTGDVQIYELYADDFADRVILDAASFTLEAGGRRAVTLTLRPDKAGEGVLETTLSVVARPLAESRFSAGTGVKIPLIIRRQDAAKKPPVEKLAYVGMAAAAGAGLGAGLLIRRRKRPAAA